MRHVYADIQDVEEFLERVTGEAQASSQEPCFLRIQDPGAFLWQAHVPIVAGSHMTGIDTYPAGLGTPSDPYSACTDNTGLTRCVQSTGRTGGHHSWRSKCF